LVQVVAGAGVQGVKFNVRHGLSVNTNTPGQEVWVFHGHRLVRLAAAAVEQKSNSGYKDKQYDHKDNQ
jgi:hypothetical protein